MPNYDGTGPNGRGPMTGSGMGYCVIPILSPEQKLDLARSQMLALQTQLMQVRNRIEEMKIRREAYHARI